MDFPYADAQPGDKGCGAGSPTPLEDMASQAETSPLLQGVCFLAMENSPLGVLEKLQPAFVIVHDPDVTFVRQLEVRIPNCLLP